MRNNKQEAKPLKLLLVGDVMLGRLVNDVLKIEPPTYPWGDTLPLFQDADIRMCNLECAISDGGTRWSATPKVFHFRSDAKNVAVLNTAHIDGISLANNHILDYDYKGLFDTIRHLEHAGIHTAGAGATLREASKPVIWEVQGRKLGLIACTDNEPDWAASVSSPGIWYVPILRQDERAHQLFETVQRTKAQVTYLVVSLHWGPNWGNVPLPEHIPFAHALIDHGADMVFGHSGHIVRGIEVYKDRPIIYCAGDFIDDYAVDEYERNDQSFIFLITLDEKTPIRLLMYPTMIGHFQARRARDSESKSIVARMQRLCTQLKTTTRWNDQEEHLEVEISNIHDTNSNR